MPEDLKGQWKCIRTRSSNGNRLGFKLPLPLNADDRVLIQLELVLLSSAASYLNLPPWYLCLGDAGKLIAAFRRFKPVQKPPFTEMMKVTA